MFDALVVGAGPAGSQTAHNLSRRGHAVAILDYRLQPGAKLCTGIVGLECVERYSVPPNLIFRSVQSALVVPPQSGAVRIRRDKALALVIDRVRFVGLVSERARDAGAVRRLGRRVTRIEVLPDRVIAEAEFSGHIERYEARAIVVASGFGSRLPGMVGLERAGTPGYAAQTTIHGVDLDEIRVYAGTRMPSGFFGWVVPTAGGAALAGALGRRRPVAALQALLAGLPSEGIAFEDAGPLRAWGVPLRPAARSVADRVMMVGDAAGQVKPTTGGGIYYSMLAGDLAADALDSALRTDDLSAAGLAAYDRAWRNLLGRELRIGYVARTIYERLSAADLEKIVRLAASNGLLESGAAFDWHADLVMRALSYKLLDSILTPFRKAAARVASVAGG